MAITSTEVYTKDTTIGDLRVQEHFKSLMVNSVGTDSIYIRAKDTMQSFFDSSSLNDTEKATVLSGMLTSMVTSITGQAMTSAITIAKENRESIHSITKLQAETVLLKEQANKIAGDRVKLEADILSMTYDNNTKLVNGWKVQSDMVKDNGFNIGAVQGYTGFILPDSVTHQAGSGTKEAQIAQSKATHHATLAKSLRESGNITWTAFAPGAITLPVMPTGNLAAGLTEAQTKVAIRQELAFEDNKRQHAANSSAAMMGMLVSSGNEGLINGTISADPDSPLDMWDSSIAYLTTDSI